MKRFYKDVSVAGDFSVLLDGKPVKTPAKRQARPADAGAGRSHRAGVARAGRRRSSRRPCRSPSSPTRRSTAPRALRDDIAAELLGFGRQRSSLLPRHRAGRPHRRASKQAWDPLLDWAHQALWRAAENHAWRRLSSNRTQRPSRRSTAALRAQDAWTLTGLQTATTITGSLVLALAMAEGRLVAGGSLRPVAHRRGVSGRKMGPRRRSRKARPAPRRRA